MAKAAFVALAGRPSSGKSTLVNLLCGHMVAIVSPLPQTTRNAIRGIVNRDEGQLVLVDTPGLHVSAKKFNRRLEETALNSAADADIVLYILDATRRPGDEEELAAKHLYDYRERLIAVINKTDCAGNADLCAAFLESAFPSLAKDRIFRISALKNLGVDALLAKIFEIAPEGEAFYPGEYYTDQELDFRIAEIIRGEAIKRLRQEIPHALYVEIADTELRETASKAGGRLWVRAFIVCERESQKGMIVGKGGEMIKSIGEAARKKLNGIFDWKVELDLRVKTGRDWRHNDPLLKKLLR